MRYQWQVEVSSDGRLYGATWRTTDGTVDGRVDPTFTRESDARGHAAMWIARYEDALATPAPAPIDAPVWQPTADDLADALAAYQSQFAGGDVTLGGA